MAHYSFTAEQSAAIVARWNELAKNTHQLAPGDAYLLLGDDFDSDMDDDVPHIVEVREAASKSGNPETFDIMKEDVTVDA